MQASGKASTAAVADMSIRCAAMAHLCEIAGCQRHHVGCLGWKMEGAASRYAATMAEDYVAVVQRLVTAVAARAAEGVATTALDADALLSTRDEDIVAGTAVAEERAERERKIEHAYVRLKELEKLDTSNIDAESTMAQCRRCKSKDIEFTSRQKASADEPATITCKCSNCGERWKLAR